MGACLQWTAQCIVADLEKLPSSSFISQNMQHKYAELRIPVYRAHDFLICGQVYKARSADLQ